MSTIKMVALKRHAFGTGTREEGEEYTATPHEARTLKALGWAKEAIEEVEKPHAKDEKDSPKERRAYKRRDLKAEK